MRFEREDVAATRDDRLERTVTAFTPLMRRVCGFLQPEELEAMIERMARNHLAGHGRPEKLRPPLGTRRPARNGTALLQRTPRPIG